MFPVNSKKTTFIITTFDNKVWFIRRLNLGKYNIAILVNIKSKKTTVIIENFCKHFQLTRLKLGKEINEIVYIIEQQKEKNIIQRFTYLFKF